MLIARYERTNESKEQLSFNRLLQQASDLAVKLGIDDNKVSDFITNEYQKRKREYLRRQKRKELIRKEREEFVFVALYDLLLEKLKARKTVVATLDEIKERAGVLLQGRKGCEYTYYNSKSELANMNYKNYMDDSIVRIIGYEKEALYTTLGFWEGKVQRELERSESFQRVKIEV